MSDKFTPLHDKVVIREVKNVTKSALVLPKEENKPGEGEVVAVGPGRVLENGQLLPVTVKVGNKVVFQDYASVEVEVNNEKFKIVRETDIYSVLN
jgi:chaperonin GroES